MTPMTWSGPKELVWHVGHKVSGLEGENKSRQREKVHSWRDRRNRKQWEGDMLGAAVASGGFLTDSEWHVVFSAAAIQPCAHQRLLHHSHARTQISHSQLKRKKHVISVLDFGSQGPASLLKTLHC